MSLETEVQELKLNHKTLDAAFHDMMKIIGGTHEVVTLILKEQLEIRKEMIEFRKESRDNFQQLGLLIRQTHSNH